MLFLLLVLIGTSSIAGAQDEPQASTPHTHSVSEPRADETDFNLVAPDKTPKEPLLPGGLSKWSGNLVYAFDSLQKGFEQTGIASYLVLKEVKANEDIPTAKARFYTVKKTAEQRRDIKFGVIFDPQFAPNGKHILFKFGNPDTYGSYHLYILDTASDKIRLATPRTLTYRKTAWSPDSEYIAYVSGGDAQGRTIQGEWYLGPLRLYACHRETGKESLVVENDTVRDSFSWANPHTLLYAVLSKPEQEVVQKLWQRQRDATDNQQGKRQTTVNPRPSIYEYSVEQGKARILIPDGYRPLSSANGEWIAFFGSEEPNKAYPLRRSWMERPGDAVLTLSRYEGSERKALNLEPGFYPYILWTPNSRHLLTVQDVEDGVKDGQAKVTEWDARTGKFRVITVLQEKNFGRAISDFQPVEFAPDNTSLFIKAFELTGRRIDGAKGVFMTERNSLHAIELATGNISPVAQFKHNWGIDWFMPPAPSATD
jgi:hypothetical protein